MHWIVKHMSLK
uniref:Uncharacterized protein n=1 Tax=Rhizophora mucronata TaxID=61149 RepID=A0A2P2Q3V7_RHIMU